MTLIIFLLLLFRLIVGVVAEFGDGDEFQIYLIGLKAYTTSNWPFFGPDIVYTETQIPGALQGLLVSLPFHLMEIPEAPGILLSFLGFLSFGFLALYIIFRFPKFDKSLVWLIVMTLPWSIYGTKILNPAYAMLFSVPFFICILELLNIFKKPFLNKNIAFLILGIAITSIMQLHLSWVLLLPYVGLVFLIQFKNNYKKIVGQFSSFSIGLLIGALTLIPTLISDTIQGDHMQSNIVFNLDNWKNLPVIIARFFAFAAYEIPVILGSNTPERLDVLLDQVWMIPFTIVVLIAGFLQVGLFLFFLFKKENSLEIKKIKLLLGVTILLVFSSFFFSIKGPSSYTFVILIPLPIFYSFYCYSWMFDKYNFTEKILNAITICGILFHIGLGVYDYKYKSIYTYKDKIEEAFIEKNHQKMGLRRPEMWNNGKQK